VSPLDPEIPPAGEEIHLPGPTLLPVAFAVGSAIALIGVVEGPIFWVPGVLIVLFATIRWILDTRREIDELPLEHEH
jgi:mannose/fructose/N-acetylgalactosamine-specific phosphotransferase system component IID